MIRALNTLVHVTNVFDSLWCLATCPCCRQCPGGEYTSAGWLHAATAILTRHKHDQMLNETSPWSAKPIRKRKQDVEDEQRRGVANALLIKPTPALEFQKLSRQFAVNKNYFTLEAQGATTRDVTSSDVAVNTFPGVFSAGGKNLNVLCLYIAATKTAEGIVLCIRDFPQVDSCFA